MRRIPWITAVVAVALAANPVGMGFLKALWSGEQLSRNIAAPFVVLAAVLLAVAALVEIAIRRRRSRSARNILDRGQ